MYLSHQKSHRFFKRFYLFIFREREEKKKEKHQCVVASQAPPTGDLAHNLGVCPGWESNQQPFGSQACVQPTELCQPGQISQFFFNATSY